MFTWSEAASPVVQDELRQWLAQTAEFESRTDFGSTQIEAYDLHPGQVGRLDPYAVQFGGDFALVGITPAHDTLKAGDDLPLTLRWQSLAPVNTPYSATLQLIDKRGEPWAVSGRPVLAENSFLPVDWPVSHIADQQFDLKVPPETPPGRYEIQVSSNLPDGQRLGLVSAAGIFSGTAPALASVQIDPIDRPRGLGRSIEYPFSHTWGAAIELLGFDDGPGVVINGDPWTVDLVWRGLRADLPRLRVVWQVRDQNEALVYETDMPLSTYSTSRWRAGEVIGAH